MSLMPSARRPNGLSSGRDTKPFTPDIPRSIALPMSWQEQRPYWCMGTREHPEKTAIMILSAHSALGKGSRLPAEDKSDYDKQCLNYTGHTWASRWLLAVLPRKMYDDARTGNFQKVLEYLVEDMRSLFYDGITSRDGTTYFFAVIHVMGDWPFLAKAF